MEEDYNGGSLPSLEQRYLAVFKLYNVIKYFYPYISIMDRSWDDVLNDTLPKLEKINNHLGYHLMIAEMVSQLNDSHASTTSNVLSQYIGTHVPPVLTRCVEGETVVTDILDLVIQRSQDNSGHSKNSIMNPVNPGLAVGDIILKIGSETVAERKQKLAGIISASTTQALEWKMNQKLLAGEKDSALILEVSFIFVNFILIYHPSSI